MVSNIARGVRVFVWAGLSVLVVVATAVAAGDEQADRPRSSIIRDGSDGRHVNGKVECQGRIATPRLQGVKRDDR